MKSSPLSAVLADDLLLDRVGARLDTDDDLGALLLAVAHHADTPIPRAVRTRRRRGHHGLTVLAALGVAVSGATVAAAVDLAPMRPDGASGAPHTRTFLPPSLQALVMPFLAGTPFQGRLVLPFGSLPTVPFAGTATAAGLPGSALPIDALALPSSGTHYVDSVLGKQEQQDLSRQTTQAKGTQTTGVETGGQVTQAGTGTAQPGADQGEQPQTAPTPKPTKPTPTPTPTPTTTPTAGTGNGATYGQANGAGNGHGRTTRGTTSAGTTTGATTGTGTTDSTITSGTATAVGDTGDDPVSGGPDKHGVPQRITTSTTTSGQAGTVTSPSKAKTTGGTASTTTVPPSTATGSSSGTAATDGTVTP